MKLLRVTSSDREKWNSLLEQDLSVSEFTIVLEKSISFFIATESKIFVGCVSLFQITEEEAYLDYYINKNFRGRGHSKKAIPELLKFAEEQLKLSRIKALVSPENLPSLNIIKELGFELLGNERNLLLFQKKISF